MGGPYGRKSRHRIGLKGGGSCGTADYVCIYVFSRTAPSGALIAAAYLSLVGRLLTERLSQLGNWLKHRASRRESAFRLIKLLLILEKSRLNGVTGI